MQDKYLLTGEKIITQTAGGAVTLTNLRIQYARKDFGSAYLMSIMLHKISSIEVKYRSKMIFLILGIMGFVVMLHGLIETNNTHLLLGLVTGVFFVVLYFITRKHTISIASDNARAIWVFTKGMKHDAALQLINRIEQAINENRMAGSTPEMAVLDDY